MPFAVAVSQASHVEQVVQELGRAVEQLGTAAELALLFYSPHYAADATDLARLVHGRVQPHAMLGVLGESIIAGGREYEQRPAVALWLASWHGRVTLDAFALTMEDTPDGLSLFGWPDALLDADPKRSLLLAFGDPYSFPVAEQFLPTLNDNEPAIPVCGGMASNPTGPSEQALILNGEVQPRGGVAVLLQGEIGFHPVVSQGCRPVGKPLVITKATDNIIHELGGQTPLLYLRQLLEAVDPVEKELLQRGVLLGLALTEFNTEGDYLIRTLLGLDPRTGALAVTERVRVGQTVRFHVRDARSASADWNERLGALPHDPPCQGGLLFSCNGRGSRLFEQPHHDAEAVQRQRGPIPMAGFFAAGELGPVSGKNFIHGFTASGVFFRS